MDEYEVPFIEGFLSARLHAQQAASTIWFLYFSEPVSEAGAAASSLRLWSRNQGAGRGAHSWMAAESVSSPTAWCHTRVSANSFQGFVYSHCPGSYAYITLRSTELFFF